MFQMASLPHQDGGFSLIEVIAVLLITGIIAAVVISKSNSTSSYSVSSEAAILKTHLRFAQMKSMGDISPNQWGINVGSSSYTLYLNGVAANINLPGENSNTHAFSGGVTATPVNISFDNIGSPGSAGPTISLNGSSATAAVTVTKNTGFIP